MNRHIFATVCRDNISEQFTMIINIYKRLIRNTNVLYEIGKRKYIFVITT